MKKSSRSEIASKGGYRPMVRATSGRWFIVEIRKNKVRFRDLDHDGNAPIIGSRVWYLHFCNGAKVSFENKSEMTREVFQTVSKNVIATFEQKDRNSISFVLNRGRKRISGQDLARCRAVGEVTKPNNPKLV